VTPKFNFPSWNPVNTYSTMLRVSNDNKFMLVTCNANDFLLGDISNLTIFWGRAKQIYKDRRTPQNFYKTMNHIYYEFSYWIWFRARNLNEFWSFPSLARGGLCDLADCSENWWKWGEGILGCIFQKWEGDLWANLLFFQTMRNCSCWD